MIQEEKPEHSILDDKTLALKDVETASHDTKEHNDPLTMEPAEKNEKVNYYEDVEHFDKYKEDQFPSTTRS